MRVDRTYPEDLPQNERFLVTMRRCNNAVPYALSINTRGIDTDRIFVSWSAVDKTVILYSQEYDQGESMCLSCRMLPESMEEQLRLNSLSIASALHRNPDTGSERLYIMFIREGG